MEAGRVRLVGVVVHGLAVVAPAPGAAVVDVGRRAEPLEHVAFHVRLVGRGEQPEGGPGPRHVRHLSADFEVAVLLLEHAQGVQHARRIVAAVGRVVVGGGGGGDAQHAVGNRERIHPDVLHALALEPGLDVDLALAVGGDGVGGLVLEVAAEIGPPEPGAGGGVQDLQAVELVVEGHRAELRGVQRQQELTVDEASRRDVAHGQALAGRELDHHVGTLLGHGRAHVGRALEAVAQELQLVVAVPVVDHVVAVPGPLHEGGALVDRADQDVVAGAAVDPLAAVDGDQVVEVVAHRVVEVAVDDQVLDVGGQLDRGPADLGVDAAVGVDHLVLRVGDPVAVVPRRAHQHVAAAIARHRGVSGRGLDRLAPGRSPGDVARLRRALGHRLAEVIVIGHCGRSRTPNGDARSNRTAERADNWSSNAHA